MVGEAVSKTDLSYVIIRLGEDSSANGCSIAEADLHVGSLTAPLWWPTMSIVEGVT
jgi:hypothetical protein